MAIAWRAKTAGLLALVGGISAHGTFAEVAALTVSTQPQLTVVAQSEGHRIFAVDAGTQVTLRVHTTQGGGSRDVTSTCSFRAESSTLIATPGGEITFAFVGADTPALVVVTCPGVEQAIGFEVRAHE